YAPHLRCLSVGDEPIRMLDFGCGDGGFTAAFLVRSQWPPERLWLSLVEPDATYRQQAVDRLQAFTPHPVHAWPVLPPHLHACFELILANHVLYFVPDLKGMLSSILRALATPGLFLAAMAGRANSLAQFCLRCFDLIGKPFPFRTAEDFEAALASLGEAYCTEDVHYALIFPDAEEHRLSIGRFLLGSDYDAVPRWAMLESFDPYANAGKISMPLVHKHFMVRN
ncbi:MAG: class I SAM-dependent methyltransferase, partial [Candidatus Entotheonellia bacterium]